MNLHNLIKGSVSEQLADIESHEDIVYSDPVIFHCYWDKNIEMNQVFSILSCYLTNVKDTNNKIILWHDFDIKDCIETPIYRLLGEFCEVRHFDHLSERVGTVLESHNIDRNGYLAIPSFYSDYLRLIMLSKYGGMWFDLDIMFFRRFDFLFDKYDSFVPTFGYANYPNNCVFWIKDKKIADGIISRFIEHGHGHFGMQDSFQNRGESQQNFNLESDLDLNILPCGWFDPMFIEDGMDFSKWFQENGGGHFYDEAYCYHWHNRNYLNTESESPFHRNIKKVIEGLGLQNAIKI